MLALAWCMLLVLGGICAYVLFTKVFLTIWKLVRDARQLK